MFKTSRPSPAPVALQASVPPGERIYAIGDIHGRADLLDQLLAMIDEDNIARGPAKIRLIFLGDLIDRGPDSKGVVERLMDVKARHPETHILLGNHEEVFLQAMRTGSIGALRYALRIGADTTIQSYGVTGEEYTRTSIEQLLEISRQRVPEAHLDFMADFEDMVFAGDYVFVHAGVRPDKPLDRQKINDLRWIRDDFLDYRGTLEKIVVHGHSIADAVETLPHRIGLDTGAYASGVLTAMGFEGGERWLLQTGTGPG
ncbi:serine/threonine protein phosphatase [Sphingomonas sp. LB-2]|nr:serine/threonine protein phosphatase [Sphingomonas caeni]